MIPERAGCGRAARPVRRAATGNGATAWTEAPAYGRKPPATATLHRPTATAPVVDSTPLEHTGGSSQPEFFTYLREERGLREGTIQLPVPTGRVRQRPCQFIVASSSGLAPWTINGSMPLSGERSVMPPALNRWSCVRGMPSSGERSAMPSIPCSLVSTAATKGVLPSAPRARLPRFARPRDRHRRARRCRRAGARGRAPSSPAWACGACARRRCRRCRDQAHALAVSHPRHHHAAVACRATAGRKAKAKGRVSSTRQAAIVKAVSIPVHWPNMP